MEWSGSGIVSFSLCLEITGSNTNITNNNYSKVTMCTVKRDKSIGFGMYINI